MTLGCNALQCIFHASFTPAERKAWVQAVQPSAEHCAGSEDGFSFCSSGPQYASILVYSIGPDWLLGQKTAYDAIRCLPMTSSKILHLL